jgi:hypothetical protein
VNSRHLRHPRSILLVVPLRETNIMIERVVKKFNSFEEAHRFDIEQQVNMTNAQRMDGLRILKERAYGINLKDIRECHQSK